MRENLAVATEQQESDDRVIAARCGTPAFEKAFYKDSKAAVAAGLVGRKGRDPADTEKIITALRRNPLLLVSAQADCPAQLARLKDIQKARRSAIRSGRSAASGRG